MNDMADNPQVDELASIYGDDYQVEETFGKEKPKRLDFAPWHHPVKQQVRVTQWRFLVEKLIKERAMAGEVLRYFTLPGPDLLDVRVLSEVCTPTEVRIEYLGFDDAMAKDGANGARSEIEATLRQARRITDDAQILPDKLQDIADQSSQAHRQLRQRRPFDVVNIDACDHLAYKPSHRDHNMFDALKSLLAHQMQAANPWLLFVTTRAEPGLMDGPGETLKATIEENLKEGNELFRPALAEMLAAEATEVDGILPDRWATGDADFLKLYAVALTKFLLKFYAAQPNHPANVELASSCTYRVYGDNPDMLALAFRITPGQPVIFEPGGALPAQTFEPGRAAAAARRARKLRDLDAELANDAGRTLLMAQQSMALLSTSNYDVDAYCDWLAKHTERPVIVDKAEALAFTA